MISLMCLAAASLVANIGGTTIQQHDLKTPITSFVSQNFSTFVNKYNEFHENSLIATKLLRFRNLVL